MVLFPFIFFLFYFIFSVPPLPLVQEALVTHSGPARSEQSWKEEKGWTLSNEKTSTFFFCIYNEKKKKPELCF